MKVFMIHAEGERRVVEASDFGESVNLWRDAMVEELGSDWERADPESVELLSDEPVIRSEESVK